MFYNPDVFVYLILLPVICLLLLPSLFMVIRMIIGILRTSRDFELAKSLETEGLAEA